MTDAGVEPLLRELRAPVLGALTRRFGMFELCEDAVQEAALAASVQWPVDGTPENPRAWLVTVASRRLTDQLRTDSARRRREQSSYEPSTAPPVDEDAATGGDDSVALLFLACHPVLTPPSQIALTLRSVGGLTTEQIAAAFLVPEATMAQRISRAKKTLTDCGARFGMPSREQLPTRLAAVLQVIYLIFNEGYASSSGAELTAPGLTAEALFLARRVHAALPDDGEVVGLLALMLLTEARHGARITADGALVPLADQDRTAWDRELITEGIGLLQYALQQTRLGPYQLQAAIAAVHCEAADTASTDWPQILGLYELLERVAPNPVVTLNRAVAVAMVHGPRAGLRLLDILDGEPRITRHHRLPAVRAHLLEMSGDRGRARAAYLTAARLTTSLPERRFLESRAAHV